MNKKEKLIPLPVSVIEKMQEAFEEFYLRKHDKWLKVQEIGDKVIKRSTVTINGKICYQVTEEEYKTLDNLYQEATEII